MCAPHRENPITIDTLGYTKYLEAQGVPRATAEAHAEAANRYLFPQLATKADVTLAVTDLRAEISNLKVWLVSVIIGVAGLSIAIAKIA